MTVQQEDLDFCSGPLCKETFQVALPNMERYSFVTHKTKFFYISGNENWIRFCKLVPYLENGNEIVFIVNDFVSNAFGQSAKESVESPF